MAAFNDSKHGVSRIARPDGFYAITGAGRAVIQERGVTVYGSVAPASSHTQQQVLPIAHDTTRSVSSVSRSSAVNGAGAKEPVTRLIKGPRQGNNEQVQLPAERQRTERCLQWAPQPPPKWPHERKPERWGSLPTEGRPECGPIPHAAHRARRVHLRHAAGNRQSSPGPHRAPSQGGHHLRLRFGYARRSADRCRQLRLRDDPALPRLHGGRPRWAARVRLSGRCAGHVHAGPLPPLRGISAGEVFDAGARDASDRLHAPDRDECGRRRESQVPRRRHHAHQGPHQPDGLRGQQPAAGPERRALRAAVLRHGQHLRAEADPEGEGDRPADRHRERAARGRLHVSRRAKLRDGGRGEDAGHARRGRDRHVDRARDHHGPALRHDLPGVQSHHQHVHDELRRGGGTLPRKYCRCRQEPGEDAGRVREPHRQAHPLRGQKVGWRECRERADKAK